MGELAIRVRPTSLETRRVPRTGSGIVPVALVVLIGLAGAACGSRAAEGGPPAATPVVRGTPPADSTADARGPRGGRREQPADSVASRPPPATAVGSERPDGRPLPDYVARIRSGFTPENRAYSRIRALLAMLDPLCQIAIALFLLFTGLSARMRDLAGRLFRGRYGRMLVTFALFNLAGAILDVPLSYYAGFALEHRFGLSSQALGQWLADQGKDLLVATAVFGGSGLVALAYLAIERSPRRWWLWLGLGTLPLLLVAALLQPLVVDPLYNRFTPLPNQELRAKIVELAARAGIPGRNVYQVDRSRQTNKYNAYVSGFGVSQRIVLWDTTVRGLPEDEILVVMAHEMGHYRLAHIWKGITFAALLSFALFWIGGVLMRAALARFGPRWGFDRLHDPASLPLFAAALSLVLLLAQPLTNAFSRAIEHEADTFALEVTHANGAAARAFIDLASQNRSDPEPPAIVKILEYTHPPLIERVRFAMTYRPWDRGTPNRVFRPAP
jgi:Zn-dependent protease with chaperone function